MLPLVVFSVIAAVCLVSSFWLISSNVAMLLIKHGGYWLMMASFLVFIFALFKNRNLYLKNPLGFIKSNKWIFVVSAAVVGILFLIQDTWFKITMDEFVLASTSMQMHLEKEVFTASRAYEVNGVFYLLGGYLDKRPYFFAFIVSIVHDLFGYRANNVFYVNAVVSFLLLVSMFFVGKSFGGKRWGWVAFLLIASFPLFGVNVTGGGFELFNLLMILLTCYLGKWWLDKPSDTSLVAFTFSGILLAQCRYESILFVFPVGLLILYGWWTSKKIRLPWPMFLTPLCLMPYVFQNRILNESMVLWQLEEHQLTPFGMQYLKQNLQSAWGFFGQMGWDQSNSPLLLALVVISLVLWVLYRVHYSAFYPREKTAWRIISIIFGITIVLNFLMLMFYYWGQLDDPVATRLGLPLHLAAIVFIVFVLSRKPWDQSLGNLCLVVSFVFAWFFAVPNISQANFIRGVYDARQIRWVKEFIEDRPGPLLVLYNHNLATLVDGIASVPVDHGIDRLPELNLHFVNKSFSEVLLVQQHGKPDTNDAKSSTLPDQEDLEAHFDLEVLANHDLGPGFYARIYRVTGIRMNEAEQATYQEYLTSFAEAEQESANERIAYFSKWLP